MAAKLLSCRHTDDMIHKLESAGLGYHVKTDESEDRLGMKLFSCGCTLDKVIWSTLRTTIVKKASSVI